MNKSNITEFLETDIPIILVNENLTIEYENRAFYSLARTFSFSVFNFLETSDITKIQEWLSSRKPDDIYEAIIKQQLPEVKAEPVLFGYYEGITMSKLVEWAAKFNTAE